MFRTIALMALTALMGVNAFVSPVATGFAGSAVATRSAAKTASKPMIMSAAEDAFVPDMDRRAALNLVLAGSIGVNVLGLAVPYLEFFAPPGAGGGDSGDVVAKDTVGNEVTVESWLATHPVGSRELAEGIKVSPYLVVAQIQGHVAGILSRLPITGDATYLVVTEDKKVQDYGINAVCTHLGCIVPWNRAESKFICMCHDSQYDATGKVVKGPAPLSLALAHVEETDGKVVFKQWTETDFRDGEKPWWS